VLILSGWVKALSHRGAARRERGAHVLDGDLAAAVAVELLERALRQFTLSVRRFTL
jgi:hypothetical protein